MCNVEDCFFVRAVLPMVKGVGCAGFPLFQHRSLLARVLRGLFMSGRSEKDHTVDSGRALRGGGETNARGPKVGRGFFAA